MQEIKLKDNATNYKVFVNDFPSPTQVPKDIIELLAKAIQGDVLDSLAKATKRKKYYKKAKEKNLETNQP